MQYHRPLLLLLFLLSAIAAFSQPKPVTVRVDYDVSATAAAAGVSAWTANTPGFAEAWQTIRDNPKSRGLSDFEPLRMLALIVRNDSGRTIGYLSVRHTYTFQDGSVHHGGAVVARSPVLGGLVKPGETYLIFPAMGAFAAGVGTIAPQSIAQLQQLVAQCQAVEISLDAVTFEDDGSLVGPDRSGLRVRYEAERAAVLSVSRALAGRSHSEAERYLAQLATAAPQGPFEPENANRYTEYWATLAQRTVAHSLQSVAPEARAAHAAHLAATFRALQ